MPNLNENVKVELFAFEKNYKTKDIKSTNKIVDVIKQDILPKDNVEYYTVKVRVKHDKDGNPDYMVLYKLRKDSYTAEVAKIIVDKDYKVKEIVNDYDDDKEEDSESEKEKSNLEYTTYDFVFATPVSYITTARNAVNELYNMAIAAGYSAKKLFDADANVANYKHYLTSGIKGFVNIGHGNTSEIVLDDGRLNHTWFSSLAGNALNPTVVYFNSCQVFNSPLQPAIMNSGARTYVGGILNLSIGPSEEVCKCFWHDILSNGKKMGDALRDCEATHYHTANAHGISGDLGRFRRLVIRPTRILSDPRCNVTIRPTWKPHDPRCNVTIRPTLNPRDPRCIIRPTLDPSCMIRPTRDPSCMIRPTLRCPIRPTLACGSHIPDMPHRLDYSEYYDPYLLGDTWYDDEMWYEGDEYDYWDVDKDEE